MALGVTATGFGALMGTAVIAGALWGVRTMQLGAPPTASMRPDPSSPWVNLLAFGTVGGLVVAAAATWALLAPVTSAFRRFGLAMASVFLTVIASSATMPIDMRLGRSGLLGVLAACALAALALSRRLGRLYREASE